MAQYLRHSKSASYADDDDAALNLGDIDDFEEAISSANEFNPDFMSLSQNFEPTELASCKYYAGYIVSTVLRNNVACRASLIINTDSEPEGSLIALREYRKGCLTHPSDEVVEMLKTCDACFSKGDDSAHARIKNSSKGHRCHDAGICKRSASRLPEHESKNHF